MVEIFQPWAILKKNSHTTLHNQKRNQHDTYIVYGVFSLEHTSPNSPTCIISILQTYNIVKTVII